MDYRQKFAVKLGSVVDLSATDPDYTGDFKGKKAKDEAKDRLKEIGELLSELQTRLFANAKRKISTLLILQAPDTAGKDGIIKHVFGFFNPQGYSTASFKKPSELELSYHFLRRAEMAEPANGGITVFNRSHYEDVLIVRVRNLIDPDLWNAHFKKCLETLKVGDKLIEQAAGINFKDLIDEYGFNAEKVKQAYQNPAVIKLQEALAKKGIELPKLVKNGVESFWQNRFDEINAYEAGRAANGMEIQKFYLHISKEEQLARIWDRVNDPQKNWKLTDADFSERKFWDAYRKAYESMLSATSTPHAPWYVIPANKKWFSRIAVAEITAAHFKDMNLEYPKSELDVEAAKEKYFGIKKPGDEPRFDMV